MNFYLQDVIPHGAAAYWHVLEAVNRAYFPVQILSIALGLILVVFTRLKPAVRRAVMVSLAIAWTGLGMGFFLEHYARLNWLSGYLTPVCLIQAVILVAYVILSRPSEVQSTRTGVGL